LNNSQAEFGKTKIGPRQTERNNFAEAGYGHGCIFVMYLEAVADTG